MATGTEGSGSTERSGSTAGSGSIERSSAIFTFWVVVCIGAASLQGIRFSAEPLSHGGALRTLLAGVSLGALLFPMVCWLPILTARRVERQRGFRLLLPGQETRWLVVAWSLWCLASLVSVLANGGLGLGFRAVGEVVLVGLSFLGLATWFAGMPRQQRSSAVGFGLFLMLVLLAALGALEMALPRLGIFELLRTESSRSIFPRIAGVMSWPNAYGLVLVVGTILGHAQAVQAEAASRSRRIFLSLGQCLLLTQLAASGSRNAWVIFLLANLVLWALGWGRRRLVLGVLLFALTAAFLPVSARQLGFSSPVLPSLVQWLPTSALSEQEKTALAVSGSASASGSGGTVGDPQDTSAARSLGSRRVIWSAALDAFGENPLVGIGAGRFESEVGKRVGGRSGLNAHSLPLNLVAETGLLGVLTIFLVVFAFLRPWVSAVVRSWCARARESQVWWVAFAALGLGQLVDCLTYDGVVVAVWCVLAAQVWCASLELLEGSKPSPDEGFRCVAGRPKGGIRARLLR